MEVYRITASKWANNLTGSGYTARWNSAGFYVVYCASSRALACLENIVHRNSIELALVFKTGVIYIPDIVEMEEIDIDDLPVKWDKPGEDGYQLCRPFGDDWVRKGETAILKVPSAIIKNDFNYIINPNYPDINNIQIKKIEPFIFDSRIKD